MKRTVQELSQNVRVSIVEWNEHDFSVQTQYRMFPNLDPHWKEVEVLDERELGSSMQVYGYLQEMREEHL